MTEDQLQAKCFQYHWNEYPKQRKMLFAVPNGGSRDFREAAKFKATGVVAGVSDMVLLLSLGRCALIEFKTEIGKQSDAQIEWQLKVCANGHIYIVIRTFEQFVEFLKKVYEL